MYSKSWASFSAQVISRVRRSWAKPGDPGPHDEPLPVGRDLVAQLLEEGRPDRARADEAHVAAQDVPELRQLVELGAPQLQPDACQLGDSVSASAPRRGAGPGAARRPACSVRNLYIVNVAPKRPTRSPR